MLRLKTTALLGLAAAFTLTGCGNGSLGSVGNSVGSIGSGSLSGGGRMTQVAGETVDTRKTGQAVELATGEVIVIEQANRRKVLGGGRGSLEAGAQVNKYIWNAALDVLSFLPVQSADPFTGVIITGYGTPPGGGRSYRAVIHVTDPALDARTLNLSLYTRGGAVTNDTIHAVEDAILTRARQLRSGK
ncbi:MULTISPECIES: DUF3576 domain-containing protein [Pacificibacter]|uniref:DUF3576 domain-containing protein n=1 Tax=Pacificibacter TaxID=1042323 RepID=UPI001C081816|nr:MULTISPECIES: DUF3576 domain-containing protein [Pacificibacter]MBU2936018.1 DUF3576 domain-containing protein [Pacificibacter marinus]MDO6615133.1 DUF3576 domain-containing protein [Pacificibacter sp. 1_MG-2023]